MFQNRGFASFVGVLVASGFAMQIQTVAVGWQVYDKTRDPFDLGLVGLSQFLPALLLVFVTGAVADRYPRRAIMVASFGVMALASLGLILITLQGGDSVLPIFACLALFGTARAFYNPARQSILPNLVPTDKLAGAVAINSTTNQIATICGPVAGGLLYGLSPVSAYGSSLGLLGIAALMALGIPRLPRRDAAVQATLKTLGAGVQFILRQKVVLGAISLDLFAVLLGGAVALLPVYANDVLDIGPAGLGALRAAPAVGAILTGVYLATRPIEDGAGRILFMSVATFGIFTMVFALSETLWISIAALAILGGADMVSVYVRSTLIQLWTPDDLRGRVNAVNQVFIGASNELGGFRAGTMASVIGPIWAVLAGGAGVLAVAGIFWRAFPELAAIRRLDRERGEAA